MASNNVLTAVQNELARLGRVDAEELGEKVSAAKGFYGEGDIPVPEKEK